MANPQLVGMDDLVEGAIVDENFNLVHPDDIAEDGTVIIKMNDETSFYK